MIPFDEHILNMAFGEKPPTIAMIVPQKKSRGAATFYRGLLYYPVL